MAIRRAAVLAAVLTGLVPFAPANAAEPTIDFKHSPAITQSVGGGVFAAVFCQGQAMPATTTQVPVAISLTCDVNGVRRTVTTAGAYATSGVVMATTPPVRVCASGEAAFLETAENKGEITLVTVGPECLIMPV